MADTRHLGLAGNADFQECIQLCNEVLEKKGHDYTSGKGRLSNFEEASQNYDVSVGVAIGILMDKHLAAIRTYIKQGQVESEPIEARIVDAINFLLLLYHWIKQEKRLKGPSAPSAVATPGHPLGQQDGIRTMHQHDWESPGTRLVPRNDPPAK